MHYARSTKIRLILLLLIKQRRLYSPLYIILIILYTYREQTDSSNNIWVKYRLALFKWFCIITADDGIVLAEIIIIFCTDWRDFCGAEKYFDSVLFRSRYLLSIQLYYNRKNDIILRSIISTFGIEIKISPRKKWSKFDFKIHGNLNPFRRWRIAMCFRYCDITGVQFYDKTLQNTSKFPNLFSKSNFLLHILLWTHSIL